MNRRTSAKKIIRRFASGFALIAAIISITCLSCAPIRKTPPVDMPESFSDAGEAERLDRWWESFNDTDLNYLIEQAMIGNLDLLSAWDRLDQATAIARIAGAALWPQVRAEAGISDTELIGEGSSSSASSSGGTTYSVSIIASYELDLWGRVRSARQAARADLSASREDLHAMAMTISGEIAVTWYELVEQRLQLDLLTEQTEVNKAYLELLELRFNYGLASASEVLQHSQQLDSTMGEMPIIEMRIEILEHKLAVLVGKPPKTELGVTGKTLPELPPLPETGIPASILLKRPDVHAAQLRLEAADYRVREAIANRFPTVSIAVSASDTEEEFRSLFDNWVRNLAINLAAPIFEGGRRKREVERARAVASERLHDFANVVLKALKEVEDALAQERHQAEYVKSLESQIELAKKTAISALERYQNGASDYLPVLNALQTLQRLERKNLEAKRLLIIYRISLYRALGGGWDLERGESGDNETDSEE